MTNENRCEPPPETPNYVVHVSDDAAGIQWRGIRYRLSALTPPATVAALVEALKHADLQLEYIDQRSPSGTTPAVRAQIDAALALYRGEAGR